MVSPFYESYIGTSEKERRDMLSELGKDNILELFSDIPEELILKNTIDIPGPYSEFELTKLFLSIAKKNADPNMISSFLGGGIRQQYIPAALEELMRRGEIYTAYTPYQPEVSQGMLQLLYEYQSMVAELLDMEVVNASMYDWASAVGEVIRIMYRLSKRNKIILAHPISPNRIEVTKTYIKHSDIELVIIDSKDGNIDSEKIIDILMEEEKKDIKQRGIAGIYFEMPNYYGTITEDAEKICDYAHKIKSYVSIGVDPISLGIIRPPGEIGADFAVGEGQLLGNAPNTGGPLLGILASKYNKKWIRQIPGRLIGETTELSGDRKGYCITLQTREQHIRREKATSNICSNEAITAVNAAIYLASLGKYGLIELSQSLMDRAHYIANQFSKIDNVKSPKFEQPFYSEFLVEFSGINHKELEEYCIRRDVIPGLAIGKEGCTRLFSVSELHSKKDLDNLVKIIKEVMS